MNTLSIFGLQLTLSVLVFALLAKWHLAPWLSKMPIHAALAILIIPHAFRHLGMVFLVPGVTSPDIPVSFASMAAYGDLASGLMAILTLAALRHRWKFALPLATVFTIIGTADLANALRHAEAVPHLWAAWYIPTFIVPVLLVTHGMVFARLFSHARRNVFHLHSPANALCATPE